MNREKYTLVGAGFGLASRNIHTAEAPKKLREEGLMRRLLSLNVEINDLGDVFYEDTQPSSDDPMHLKRLSDVLSFSAQLSEKIRDGWEKDSNLLVLGGDHSISLTTIALAKERLIELKGENAKLGVLWVDAHADLNTPETTPSGNIHGMPLAILTGEGDERLTSAVLPTPVIDPTDIVFIGLRDVDPGERDFIRERNLKAYSMTEIDLCGIGKVCTEAFTYLREKCDGFVISFDLDVCDPRFAPAVGTPVRGGLNYREAHLVMELAAREEKLLSVEFVEYNPKIGNGDRQSTELSIGLIESALGKSIL